MGWTQFIFGGGAALAVGLAALIRFFPRRGKRTDIEISPTVLGYLTGGTRRAVVTALAMLHVHGAVRIGKQGTVKRTDGKFASTDRLLSATYAALYQPNGPRGIASRPQVRRAAAEVRKDVVAGRLLVPTGSWVASRVLSWLAVPLIAAQIATSHGAASITLAVIVFVLGGVVYVRDRRTRTCRVRTRQLGREVGPDAESVGYAVAAQGKRALREIMPRFAKDAGLLDGGVAAQFTGDGSIGPNSDARSGNW